MIKLPLESKQVIKDCISEFLTQEKRELEKNSEEELIKLRRLYARELSGVKKSSVAVFKEEEKILLLAMEMYISNLVAKDYESPFDLSEKMSISKSILKHLE